MIFSHVEREKGRPMRILKEAKRGIFTLCTLKVLNGVVTSTGIHISYFISKLWLTK